MNSESIPRSTDLEPIFRRAMGCNSCFCHQENQHERGTVDIAQPRPIGENYWASDVRVVLVLLNPAAGDRLQTDPNLRFKRLLHDYLAGSSQLESVFEHQTSEMPGWGNGQFKRLYLDGYGLKLKDIATANVAWCAEQNNRYYAMLSPCFTQHTLPLLRALKPDVILLAGDKAHPFGDDIRDACPNSQVVPVLHYRPFNCLSPVSKAAHLKKIKMELERIAQFKKDGCYARDAEPTNSQEIAQPHAEKNYQNLPVRSAKPTRHVAIQNSNSRRGPYKIISPTPILKRATDKDDPRWEFYEAMTKNNRYEDYYSKFEDKKVYPSTYQSSPRTAHTEMAWARKQGWIADV